MHPQIKEPQEIKAFEYYNQLLKLADNMKIRISECAALICTANQQMTEKETLQYEEAWSNYQEVHGLKLYEEGNQNESEDEFHDAIDEEDKIDQLGQLSGEKCQSQLIKQNQLVPGKDYVVPIKKYQRLSLPEFKDPNNKPSI